MLKIVASLTLLTGLACFAQPTTAPIVNLSPDQARIIATLPDGGLPPVVGVRNIQVFRASRDVPEMADGKGWTYNHHVDLACWKGRLYVAWDNGEKDEDVWPSRQVYSTSEDGVAWAAPKELFPLGLTTSLRMYFYRASNGRMLVISGLRMTRERLEEAEKRGAVVREIRADHTLGDVFTLIPNDKTPSPPPAFSTGTDKEFIAACENLLANRPFLETQDYGNLLGERRMKWHEPGATQRPMNNFGKAFSFFHRKDGALVGIGKRGWTVVSRDEGNTWSQPALNRSLVTGNAKVCATRTSDGRYALVYNPDYQRRFPLVMITGDDGVTFDNMRVVHGEVPNMRYPGLFKSVGPQYVRGISEWATDGSRKDEALWVVYSSNKEDIWVSRIPVPTVQAGWSTYSPKWAGVTLSDDGKTLKLEDRDPYDYAQAQYIFTRSGAFSVECTLQIDALSPDGLEIKLMGAYGAKSMLNIRIDPTGSVSAADKPLGAVKVGEPTRLRLDVDASRLQCNITLNDQKSQVPLGNVAVERIAFRTGPSRGVGLKESTTTVPDKPGTPASWLIQDFTVK